MLFVQRERIAPVVLQKVLPSTDASFGESAFVGQAASAAFGKNACFRWLEAGKQPS
jgi:hypothetical protein